uniref:Endonuclease/exonuclease/phosphatase domain-containing protein n=1 Tax=viral metagenome TaxID=1070528 RepID=A0A6C0CCU7_9ZZZZ
MGNRHSTQKFTITISSRNVNCDRRCEEGGYAHKIFPYFAIKDRIDQIIDESIKDHPTIISYCEINAASLNLFNLKLDHNYQILSGAYAPNQIPDQSMYFVTAYNPRILFLIDSYMFWFTDSPTMQHTSITRKNDTVLKEANEQFEKGSLITIFKTENDSIIIHSANHLGLREKYQMICSKMLHAHLISLCRKYKKAQIIVSGDFNTFDHFENRTVAPFIDPENQSEKFKQHIDPKVPLSFVSYPYDTGLKTDAETLQKLIDESKDFFDGIVARKMFVDHIVKLYSGPITGLLDHIFTLGIDDAEFKIDKGLLDISPENLTTEFVRCGKAGIPFMASDHLQTLIKFQTK